MKRALNQSRNQAQEEAEKVLKELEAFENGEEYQEELDEVVGRRSFGNVAGNCRDHACVRYYVILVANAQLT